MRRHGILMMGLCWVWPWVACASMPGQIAPQGGFMPLHTAHVDAVRPLPSRGARFLPLAQRNTTRMMPINAQVPDTSELTREAAKHSEKIMHPPVSEEDAKLLLSIFSAGD